MVQVFKLIILLLFYNAAQVVAKQANGTADKKKAAEYIIWRYNKYTALMT